MAGRPARKGHHYVNRLEGRTVLITGAGSGIGYEMSRQFLAEGACAYAADLDPAGAPGGSTRLVLDVTSTDSVEAAVARTVADTGRLDVLCNNAWKSSTTDAISCTAEEWDRPPPLRAAACSSAPSSRSRTCSPSSTASSSTPHPWQAWSA
jgi:4-aminobutyrate aminotransferase-like enzyme